MYTVFFLNASGDCRGVFYFRSIGEMFGACMPYREIVPCIRVVNSANETVLELSGARVTFAVTPYLFRWATELFPLFSAMDCNDKFEVLFDAYQQVCERYLSNGNFIDLRIADLLLSAVAARENRDLSLLPYESSEVLRSRCECEGKGE